MISGTKTANLPSGSGSSRRGLICRALFGLILLAVLPAAVSAASWDLKTLMEELAAQGVREEAFVEEKHISLLSQPLTFTGTLRYLSPTSFEKIIERPVSERYSVEDDVLIVVRGQDAPQRIMLSEHPLLLSFIAAIRDTLAGNQQALEQHYRLQLSGVRAAWRLQLVPREPRLRSFVQVIYIEGDGGQINLIEIREANDDSSILRIVKQDG